SVTERGQFGAEKWFFVRRSLWRILFRGKNKFKNCGWQPEERSHQPRKQIVRCSGAPTGRFRQQES
ncbi:hypothetical protein pipiens_020341, partial [Culex pipiens pipiens]